MFSPVALTVRGIPIGRDRSKLEHSEKEFSKAVKEV
jgi:hypothetical protein